MIGETLGSYRVMSKLGQGGMGMVYVAEHPLIGKRVAIKVLLPQFSRDAEIVNRFFNEARSTTLIHHPGIVEIFDFGHHPNGSAFIVMEYLDGESLAGRLRREFRTPNEVIIEIARQVASGLQAAHDKGVVHRDLKPDNIFLIADADAPLGLRAKLLDFGIAKLAGEGMNSMKTQTGAIIGTPTYMSPEQCRGAGGVDHRTDIYSFGCVVYEMVCGKPPFVTDGPGATIAAHIFQEPVPLSTLVPTVPPGLQAIVDRALQKSADARYWSMNEVIAELDALVGGVRPSGRFRMQAAASAPGPAAASAPAPTAVVSRPTTLSGSAAEVVAPTPSARRGWAVPAALGLLVVGGAATLAVLHPWSGAGETVAPAHAVAIASPIAEPKPSAPAEPAPAREVAKPPAAPAAPARVRLSIDSEPAGAEVFRSVDGVRVGVTPWSKELERTDGEVVFMLRLGGYRDEQVTVPVDHDVNKVVALTRLRPHSSESKPARTSATRRPVQNGVLDPFDK